MNNKLNIIVELEGFTYFENMKKMKMEKRKKPLLKRIYKYRLF